ncbi:retrovirus-related pol polyprotein from transposon TNT 1-94 [Tanacetum coccineum]
MSPENKAHFESEKEVIHFLLTGIRDEIYSTVDACKTAHEMWEAIERLQQGESLNIQDVKTNLFWEFGKFTFHNGETIESYYTRFYKMMNEMIRNNLTVAMMQVNVQFLQQLQPEWSRFVTIVKQQHKLDEVSYHKLFDILKQYQKEVNEIRAERIANNANPLALVAAAQPHQDPYYQAPKSHKSYAPTSKASLPTRSHATTRHKGKEIAKPITPPSQSASEEDSDPEQAQKDKEMQKNLTRQFGNQRIVNVVGARETVGSQIVQQTRIQCFNYKEFGHFAKECRKPKRVQDSTYHKEKMLMCKQAEKGVQLQAEQADWLEDTDEEIDEQELEAHYSFMAKIQEVPTAESGTDTEPLEQVHNDVEYNVFANVRHHFEQPESTSNTFLVEKDDSNVTPDSPDMCDNDTQTDQNAEDERAALANLIVNLKLDVDENKKIQKKLKKANASLDHELKECKSILVETSKTLGECNSIRDSCLVSLQNKQTEFERYKALNDRTVDFDKLKHKLNETLGLLAQKDIDIKEGLKVLSKRTQVITDLKLKEEKDIDNMISIEKQLKFLNEIVYKRNQSIQTIHMLAPKGPTFNGRPTFANPMYLKRAQSEKPCLYEIPHDQSDPANRLVSDREETLTLERDSRLKLNKDLVRTYDYTKLNSLYEIFKPPTQEYLVQIAHANEVMKKMWRKSFVKTKLNIFKSIDFLPVSKSISKYRQAYNVMTNNINHFRELVDQAWNDSFAFIHELKQEMHADLKYVESLENEIDKLESDKAEFSNMYDILLQECVSNDVMCSYLHSLSDLDAHSELQCLYLHKVKECECLAQKLSKQTEFVKQMKNDTVCKEKRSNLFQKEREQYFEIQDLKAQFQDKNIAISELKKLIEKCKGKFVKTKFDKPSVVRQPNAQRIPKPLVLGKPTPFLDSFERKRFSQTKSVPKTNVSESLSKPVTTQILPQTARQATSRNTNPRVSTSTGVIHKTNVSRPQLRSNQMKDKVVPNNSQVKDKKTEVEDHPRISSISNKTKSVTVSNDSLKSRTSNVNVVCATCGKCVFNSNHDACVSKYLNDVNARTKKPKVVPISTRKLKIQANKSVATPHKKTVASESTTQKSKSYYRMLYEKTSKIWKWWIEQQCSSGYKWVPKTKMKWVPKVRNENIWFKEISRSTRFITSKASISKSLAQLCQFCDADLEVAFQKSTCFVRDLQGNDLLTVTVDLISIQFPFKKQLHQLQSVSWLKPHQPQAWLWHRRLSHLNFDYINLLSKKDVVIGLPKLKYVKDQLCSSCKVSKAKRSSFKTKVVPSSKGRLNLLHMDLCGPMRVASINGKKYILGYHVKNKRTRLIVESIHLIFDEIKEMTEMSVANDTSGLVPQ